MCTSSSCAASGCQTGPSGVDWGAARHLCASRTPVATSSSNLLGFYLKDNDETEGS